MDTPLLNHVGSVAISGYFNDTKRWRVNVLILPHLTDLSHYVYLAPSLFDRTAACGPSPWFGWHRRPYHWRGSLSTLHNEQSQVKAGAMVSYCRLKKMCHSQTISRCRLVLLLSRQNNVSNDRLPSTFSIANSCRSTSTWATWTVHPSPCLKSTGNASFFHNICAEGDHRDWKSCVQHGYPPSRWAFAQRMFAP